MVVKTLDEDDMAYIQNHVRTYLVKMLNDHSDYPDLSKHLFGDFASNPTEFVFSQSEKNLLNQIIEHLRTTEQADHTLDHSSWSEYIENKIEKEFPIGLFFTKCCAVFVNNSNLRSVSVQTEVPSSQTHKFLYQLLQNADKNFDRKQPGNRYDEDTKQFTTYVRMTGGAFTYDTWYHNLVGAIPSLSSVNRYIRENDEFVIDGKLRCNELLAYLKKRHLELVVSLSEDATRINGRVQYDKKSNQIYGFPAPVDKQTGMPIPLSFPARNAEEIGSYFSSSSQLAGYVNVIMAQPLANVAPFCLMMFSSDNKYTADMVSKRWNFVRNELQKLKINVLCISSDSDPRYNSAMRKLSQLGHESNIFGNANWFACGVSSKIPIFIQDAPHLMTKIRNLLLRTRFNPQKLKFGPRYSIQIRHLQKLIEIKSKTEHLLTLSDLYPEDKQNYPSALKICDERVINLLRENLPEAKGTAMFLEVMRNIIDAFHDFELSPLQRIEKLWYAVFILRIWREYVTSTKNLVVENNFLTQNCYSCVEINCHSLVHLILYLREQNAPHLLLPHLLDSQPCESFFRQLRSMSTVNSTVVNCSMKEILHRVNRINFQSEITLNKSFIFPRVKTINVSEQREIFELPSEKDILNQIENCRMKAIKDAKEFGLDKGLNKKSHLPNKIPVYKAMKRLNPSVKPSTKSNSITPINPLHTGRILLKNFADRFINKQVEECSPYVELGSNYKGERVIVKKTSLCWAFSKDKKKLSSDRLIRVQAPITHQVKKKIYRPRKMTCKQIKRKVYKIRKK